MDRALVEHLAQLSGLCPDEEELLCMTESMKSIKELMDKVKDFDCGGDVCRGESEEYGALRKDVCGATECIKKDFIVPKVV